MCNLISEACSSALADFSALEWKKLTPLLLPGLTPVHWSFWLFLRLCSDLHKKNTQSHQLWAPRFNIFSYLSFFICFFLTFHLKEIRKCSHSRSESVFGKDISLKFVCWSFPSVYVFWLRPGCLWFLPSLGWQKILNSSRIPKMMEFYLMHRNFQSLLPFSQP